jgi:hypothetical protein
LSASTHSRPALPSRRTGGRRAAAAVPPHSEELPKGTARSRVLNFSAARRRKSRKEGEPPPLVVFKTGNRDADRLWRRDSNRLHGKGPRLLSVGAGPVPARSDYRGPTGDPPTGSHRSRVLDLTEAVHEPGPRSRQSRSPRPANNRGSVALTGPAFQSLGRPGIDSGSAGASSGRG